MSLSLKIHKIQKSIQLKMNLGKFKLKSPFPVGLFLVSVIVVALYLTGDNGRPIEDSIDDFQKEQNSTYSKQSDDLSLCKNEQNLKATQRKGPFPGCDLFPGQWVFDNISYPLYREGQCSFMLNDYACEKYGRKDFRYQNWRWKPHGCDLPRFNGTVLLEKIRGKKLVFVGDSLNKNQWISMLCLIESSIHQSTSKSVIRNDNLFTFQAIEYNATIGFYWSPLLVESNCDDPETHRVKDRIFRITEIEKHARHWNDADILIFDSFMWWLEPTMRILWGSFGSPDAIYTKVEMRERRYEMALNTWSDWLEININRTRTKLYFMSLSPYHFYGETWFEKRNCYGDSEPISNQSYWGVGTDRDMMRIAESAIEKLERRGVPFQYINITQMSDYRRDGHPSIYRKFQEPPSEEQLKDPTSYSDCVHWCLPGVPDTWNQILYSYIINS